MNLVLIEGFEHKDSRIANFSSPINGLWYAADATSAWTFPSGRTVGGVCLQLAVSNALTRGYKQLNDTTMAVVSFYFKISGTPSITWTLFALQTIGFSMAPIVQLTDQGKLRIGSGTGGEETAAAVNNGQWHRLDFRIDTSANPWVIDWQVDGAAQTQEVVATAAQTIRYCQIGTGETDVTFTCQYDDLLISDTSADYPIGDHTILGYLPSGDGTHNVSATAELKDTAGTDIDAVTAWSLVDDWPAETSGTGFIQQTIAGAGNYAEITFVDTIETNLLGVEGVAGLYASGANANNGTTRIVDSSGVTLTDIYSGNMGDTSRNMRRAVIAAPGGTWSMAEFNGLKARVGFSSDIDSIPRWEDLLLQMAYAPAVGGAPTRRLQMNVSPRRW